MNYSSWCADIDRNFATSHSLGVNPQFSGHGIGRRFHQEPWIYHTRNAERGVMEPGDCFTIEPAITQGFKSRGTLWDDGWTMTTDVSEKRSSSVCVIIGADSPDWCAVRAVRAPGYHHGGWRRGVYSERLDVYNMLWDRVGIEWQSRIGTNSGLSTDPSRLTVDTYRRHTRLSSQRLFLITPVVSRRPLPERWPQCGSLLGQPGQ